MAFQKSPLYSSEKILSRLRAQIRSDVQIPAPVACTTDVRDVCLDTNDFFTDRLCKGRISNYIFFHKTSEPDSLIIACRALGQKQTVDFHFKITQGAENNRNLSHLNGVLCMYRRTPLSLEHATYKYICPRTPIVSIADQNVINFYNEKLTNVTLSDGTTIQSGRRRRRFVQNVMVFSIKCNTTGKNWTGLLPTRIKPEGINSHALIAEVCPYIRRYMQMTTEAYIKEMKNVSEETFDRIKANGKLPEATVHRVHHKFSPVSYVDDQHRMPSVKMIDGQCHMLSAKILTALATKQLNTFCSVDTFPLDQAMDYAVSALVLV